MASAFAHAFAAASLGVAVTPGRRRTRLIVAGLVCTVLPDLDVIGFRLGIPYGDVLGHRGVTHSLAFAALVAVAVTRAVFRGAAWDGLRVRVGLYLFVVTASHGVFDALTDGGLGVAFLAPFADSRWFLPLRPVIASPLGVREFFTAHSLGILGSEVLWIGLPWTVVCLFAAWAVRARERGRRGPNGGSR